MEGLKLELDMEGTLDPRDALKDAWDEEDSKAAELAEEDFTLQTQPLNNKHKKSSVHKKAASTSGLIYEDVSYFL